VTRARPFDHPCAEALTRAELTASVRELGFTHREAVPLLESVFSVIGDTLGRGETVKVSGFGRFEIRVRSARTGRNLHTGAEVPIGARRVVVFRPSRQLRDGLTRSLVDPT
jgi:integration host factor subunit alpha